ncbi:TlpA disulfide reductase family protein [Allomuricauda sp. SCSIO 65647]|uniref:TlpA disulfide reductase family protein n=1 Tax=Allomuricauda sp. SCSIO 65647 TaxID=2908843 RepID=UPI001F284936|nr:TlpA disulfide reductase family protein [Muricauda sp. SCSIO 65647]UJH68072.1 TlpA family protein disulfide reductase [Muricauda sp. SCSIO 65647]
MNRLFFLGFFSMFLLASCKDSGHKNQDVDTTSVYASADTPRPPVQVKFPIYDFDEFKPYLNKVDDKVHVVNFWATWCKPCIKELPYFEKVNAEQKDNGVEVLLVSLDMPSMWKSKLEPFVEKKNIQSKVIILDDPNMNDWIPKVDEDWGGGIPATLIYKNDQRIFFERGLTYEELTHEIDKMQ